MRVRTKLVTITLFVAVVPLAMSASQSLRLHERALDDALLQLHATSANLGAQTVAQQLDYTRRALRGTVQETIDWKQLDRREQEAALWLVLGQFPSAVLVTLAQQGELTHQLFQQSPASTPTQPAFTVADLEEFRRVSPPAEPNVATGAAMMTSGGWAVLPLSVNKTETDGDTIVVGLGLRLESLCAALAQARPAHGSILLLDAWNRTVCDNGRSSDLTPADSTLLSVLGSPQALYSRDTKDGPVKGAVASVDHGFRVVVEQPLTLITAPTRTLRYQVLLWLAIGVVAAVTSGWILARSILTPLDALTAAARRLGAGVFGERIADAPLDEEFAALARSFNTMSQAIEQRDQEIQAWNNELQQRVEQRGRELQQAQDALLSSRKMAGLAVATAGVAHEMNNPLTGVMGLAQVLSARLKRVRKDSQEVQMLTSIITESKRMQSLIDRMKSLYGEHDAGSHRELLAANLLDGVLLTQRDRLGEQGITVTRSYPSNNVYVMGHYERLHFAFLELLENATRAIRHAHPKDGGQLEVSIEQSSADWTDLSLTDNGGGLEKSQRNRVFEPFYTTKTDGQGEGLGLSQVYRTIEDHGGKVWFDTTIQVGARVVVRLPSIVSGAHLE